MRFFEQNCIVKWVILFASLSWFWDFLPENLKLVDKLQIQVFLIICFLVYSFFEGLSQGIFTSVILKFSILANNGQGLKNLKFWCTIFCAPCRLLVHVCTKKKKKLAPRQYFSVSHAPYCAPYFILYRKDFEFICLQISYDLVYLKLFIYYLPFLLCWQYTFVCLSVVHWKPKCV